MTCTPIWMMRSAFDIVSACASVLATTKSTALQPARDHVVDGVAAGTAGPEHGDPRLQLTDVGDLQIDGHGCLFIARASQVCDAAGRAGPPPAAWCTSCRDLHVSSEALAKPSSDPCEIAARSCHRVPRWPRFEVFEMRRLAGRPAGRSPPQKPVPSPPPAARRCRAAVRCAPAVRESASRDRASPVSWHAPPVSTTRPRGSAANGDAASRSRTISRISSTRGLMMRTSCARETNCGALAVVVIDRRHRDHVALVGAAGEHAAVERLDALGVGDARC